MGKNVAVFVDVANIFYAAKAAGVDIDYVTLLKSATAGRDFVRAYAYTGLDPDNENQRNFHNFLARHDYKVVSKDIRKYGDGKVKANLDIELVVDMLKTARNLDVAVVISGDGDFAPAIRAVQEMGVRVEVISFRGNTSSDLIDVADQFTDIVHIAKVEKGSSRSGRRVADDEEDLSMTEVPDKQTEGATRSRGRGRTRSRDGGPVSAPARGGSRRAAPAAVAVVEADPRVGLVALPGEKLSKAANTDADDEAAVALSGDERPDAGGDDEVGDDAPRRRRRRRGGRGRGRGRGAEGSVAEAGDDAAPVDDVAPVDEIEAEADAPPVAASGGGRHGASRPRQAATFGSVWDSQIGMPSGPVADLGKGGDDDFEEPEIPEYLIAEQRRGGAARGGTPRVGGRGAGGGRGGRSAYVAAVERERYGSGRGGGGLNRYPDVSGRTGRPDRGPRPERGPRPDRGGHRGSSDEPWSEVPPELEQMLLAQLASKPPQTASEAPSGAHGSDATDVVGAVEAADDKPKRRTTRTKAAASDLTEAADDKPKRRTTRTKAAASDPTEAADDKPKRRTTRTKAAASDPTEAADDKPKRRTTRAKSVSTAAEEAPEPTASNPADG